MKKGEKMSPERLAKNKKPPIKQKYVTPEQLLKHFMDYKVEVKANPFVVNSFVGGKHGAEEVEFKKEKPLTEAGFNVYLATKGILMTAKQYFDNQDNLYTAYIPVCSLIKTMIKQDQIEGGMARVYDSNITARLCGLVDKKESDVKVSGFDLTMDLK